MPEQSPRPRAIAINCTLKAAGQSSTDAMIAVLKEHFAELGVELTETIRIAAAGVKPGVTSDEGAGDGWPAIRTKILAHDILVFGTPIWMGQISSVAKGVLERMDAFLAETDDAGRMPSYSKVAVAAIVGNEDGAHWASSQLFQSLNDTGWTIPAVAACYWVGEAMGEVDFKDLPHRPRKVQQTAAMVAANAAHLAGLLKCNPIRADAVRVMLDEPRNPIDRPVVRASHRSIEMLKFITGAAAIALAATSVNADPGGGKGNGGEKSAQNGKSGGGNGGSVQAEPGNGGNGKAKNFDKRGEASDGNSAKSARGPDRFEARDKPARFNDGDKGPGKQADKAKSEGKNQDVRFVRDDERRDRFDDRSGRGERFSWASLNRHQVVEGCPPGLAKKNNGCLPPGLAKKRNDDWREGYDRPDWWGMTGYEGRYSYNDGSLLRLGSNGSILGYLPLLGGALSPGQMWPSFYEPVAVPDYYQDYYNLGSNDGYRYHDDALYSVDPQSQAISSIVALLTGDDFAVGQRMPQGYDVYNVPYSYRDEYADGPDANYRYSDGYVYQVDPKTQLIQTVIELLT